LEDNSSPANRIVFNSKNSHQPGKWYMIVFYLGVENEVQGWVTWSLADDECWVGMFLGKSMGFPFTHQT
jgi:hypothetical protein